MNFSHLQKFKQQGLQQLSNQLFFFLSKKVLPFLLVVLIHFLPFSANAQGTDSVELVHSNAYDRRADQEQTILTYVHSQTWSFGDNFYFLDMANLGNFENAGNTYFEWGPRLSPGKIFGDGSLNAGLIRDIYLIGELDYVKNKAVEKAVFLGGLSVDLAFPGFRFFKVHLFNRNDPTLTGHTQQLTLAWNLPFTFWNNNFSFQGFFDYTGREATSASNYQGQPQLLWEMNDRVSLGLEYLYWHNKTGRAGFNESAMQGVFKVIF